MPARTRTTQVGPPLLLLHGSMLLTGFGTVFLGPILPALAAAAHTSDSGSGLLFAAQFLGSLLGGSTTNARLWFCVLRGYAAALLGFTLLAFCAGARATPVLLALALFPLGFGVGQTLTAINLVVSRRFAGRRGSALNLLNLSWSLGAVAAPFALGQMVGRFSTQPVLLAVALLFAVGLALCWGNRDRARREQERYSAASASGGAALPWPVFAYFATLLLIYGGVETSISGWLTTFETRYGGGALSRSTWSTAVLWLGIAAGRAAVSLLLLRFRERTVLRASLCMGAISVWALTNAHGSFSISLWAALVGISLAPWFPLVFAVIVGEGATAGEAGKIIATSAIGAATLPWLVGAVSRWTGSLRIGLLLPLMGIALLLAMNLLRRSNGISRPAEGV